MSDSETKHTQCEVKNGILIATILADRVVTPPHAAEISAEILQKAKAARTCRVVIDFQNVRTMSSSMVGELLRLHRTFKQESGLLAVIGLNEDLRRLLKMTRLDRQFPVLARGSPEFERLFGEAPRPLVTEKAELATEDYGNYLIIRLKQESLVTNATAVVVGNEIGRCVDTGAKRIGLNCASLTKAGTPFATHLLSAKRKVTRAGGKLVLFNVNADVIEVLRDTGALQEIELCATEEDALKRLGVCR